jgi:hypothetical protein
MSRINLTDEEHAAVAKALRKLIDDDKFPLSPRLRPLKSALAKLRTSSAETCGAGASTGAEAVTAATGGRRSATLWQGRRCKARAIPALMEGSIGRDRGLPFTFVAVEHIYSPPE